MMRVSIVCCAFTMFSFSSGALDKSFNITGLVERMNYYRAMHDAPKLVLNESISKDAQEKCDYWANPSFAWNDPGTKGNGETIFRTENVITNKDYVLPVNAAVDHWYEGVSDYKFEEEPIEGAYLSLKSKFFAQLVWRNSQRVGVGVTREDADDGVNYFVVCFYSPPGNKYGEFKENVIRKTTEKVPESTGSAPKNSSILWLSIVLYLVTRVYG